MSALKTQESNIFDIATGRSVPVGGDPAKPTMETMIQWLREYDTETTDWLILGIDPQQNLRRLLSTGMSKQDALWLLTTSQHDLIDE